MPSKLFSKVTEQTPQTTQQTIFGVFQTVCLALELKKKAYRPVTSMNEIIVRHNIFFHPEHIVLKNCLCQTNHAISISAAVAESVF